MLHFLLVFCVLFVFSMAEIVEKETEAYYKMDPDPFDDRHPGKLTLSLNCQYE